MSYSYILENKPLSVTLLANTFSQSIGCLFILFMVSFAVQKLPSLIMSCLFGFALIFFCLGILTKENIYVKECFVYVFLKFYGVKSSSLSRFKVFFSGEGYAGLVVVAHGLVALWHVRSSWTRDQTCVTCIGR